MKYIIVGGVPFKAYTGTGTFTRIKCLLCTDSLDVVKEKYQECYDKSGGLIGIFDTKTGKYPEELGDDFRVND